MHRRDIEVEINYLPAAHGGRNKPAFSGYRPQFYYDGNDWDAVHEYPDVERAEPGDRVRAYLARTHPEMHLGKVTPGMPFLLREGNRVVGYGVMLRLIDLEQSAAASREGRK